MKFIFWAENENWSLMLYASHYSRQRSYKGGKSEWENGDEGKHTDSKVYGVSGQEEARNHTQSIIRYLCLKDFDEWGEGGGGGVAKKEATQIPWFMAFLAKRKQESILSPSSGIYVPVRKKARVNTQSIYRYQ